MVAWHGYKRERAHRRWSRTAGPSRRHVGILNALLSELSRPSWKEQPSNTCEDGKQLDQPQLGARLLHHLVAPTVGESNPQMCACAEKTLVKADRLLHTARSLRLVWSSGSRSETIRSLPSSTTAFSRRHAAQRQAVTFRPLLVAATYCKVRFLQIPSVCLH